MPVSACAESPVRPAVMLPDNDECNAKAMEIAKGY